MRSWGWAEHPIGILVAMPYLRGFRRHWSPEWSPLGYMLDSGAFSAWKSGKPTDIDALIEEAKRPPWTEVVGLDVIGSAEGTRRNMDTMRARGCAAMPVFHHGDPMEFLDYYCEHWDKVGISCRFGESRAESVRFVEQCFARAWPHRFHSFGWTEPAMLRSVPFHSADSSTWKAASEKFNNACVGPDLRQIHCGRRPAAGEFARYHVRKYSDLHVELAERWRKELAKL
jgi:hypothetical protein